MTFESVLKEHSLLNLTCQSKYLTQNKLQVIKKLNNIKALNLRDGPKKDGSVRLSVHPGRLAIFVILNMLELSYQFKTFHDDFYNNDVQIRKRGSSIIVMRKSLRLHLKHAVLLLF